MTDRQAHELMRHAAARRMSPLAYAIHTNRVSELYGTTVWRAYTDPAFCHEVLERGARGEYRRPNADEPTG